MLEMLPYRDTGGDDGRVAGISRGQRRSKSLKVMAGAENDVKCSV